MEEGRDALRAAVLLLEAPLAEEDGLRLGVGDHLAQLVLDARGELNLLQPALRHDAAVELRHGESSAQLVGGAGCEVLVRDGAADALARDGEREGREPRVLDEATRQLVLAGERHEVDVILELQLGRAELTPDALSQQQVGLGELDSEGDAPVHRLVQVHRPVCCEHAEPLMPLKLRQHRVDLHVALGPVHEDGLALVEEEHGVVDLCLAEDHLQDGAGGVAAELREVDHEHLLADHGGERVGQHGLARARGAVEE
mmetsp:Transcript_21545/g.46363  ORF Transcript_21545/g.46363 Transcript_21545/m.46363 type:complete len:256 (-) Transcript_21545:988-1755(-)